MRASKCDYYEISAKVIRMPEKFSWGVKHVKRVGFSIRMALSHEVQGSKPLIYYIGLMQKLYID